MSLLDDAQQAIEEEEREMIRDSQETHNDFCEIVGKIQSAAVNKESLERMLRIISWFEKTINEDENGNTR